MGHKIACLLGALAATGCGGGDAVVADAAGEAVVGPSPSPMTMDLGDVRPGDDVPVTIPPSALGFTVVVRGSADDNVGIRSLVAPSGSAVVTDFVPAGGTRPIALGSRGLGSSSVPQSSTTATAPLEPGAWHLVVGGFVPDPTQPIDKSQTSSNTLGPLEDGAPLSAPLHVTITLQTSSDGAFHGGALDLHAYVPEGLRIHDPVPLHAISAADAANDVSMQRRIDTFYRELERLFGIGRGTVTFHPIDARFTSAKTGVARAALLAAATTSAVPALHVVFTNELSYTEGDPLLGYSVGLPGAPGLGGTVLSSISVALYADQPAENDAISILHEMGHFAGLMHTTDYDGTPDLLDDTPQCKKPPCPDADNLMAPDGPAGVAVVSASQVRVVRGASIYRAFR